MNQELLNRVLESPRLPSLPTIALEIISLAQDPDAEFGHVAETIQHDPALSGKILKTVNSALYGQAREVSTVTRALQVLGLNTVKTLALGFSLVGNLKSASGNGMDYVQYWRRSLYAATAAKALSRRAGVAQYEEVFLGGLLQDLGMVAMSQALGEDYAAVLECAGTSHAALSACEVASLEVNHADVGAALAESWGLPPLLVAPIRFHETPMDAPDDLEKIVRSVALGNDVANIFLGDEGNGEGLAVYYERAEEWFGIGHDGAIGLLGEIHSSTGEMGNLFDLPTGDLGNSEEILARATDALTQMTLQAQRANQQLIAAANTDALTGAMNRRGFDQFFRREFELATAEHPVSLLFVDIDHFKRFNDTYGHAVGDRVLVVFTQTLQRSVGDGGRVFRCGGEEFGIVCQADGESAATTAEAIRSAVEDDATVTADDGESLRVTCSIGVATHTGKTFDDVARFLRATDESLYDAKEAGRNCVRSHSTSG